MLDDKVSPRKNAYSKMWEYELLEDLELEYEGETIVVPRYFSYDGATIPSLAWQMMYTPFDPIVMTPALVHDWLYATHQLEKEDVDCLFEKLLRENGVPPVKADLMFRGVEFFGAAAWENSDDDLKYLRWLRKKLLDNGVSVAKYRFPEELDS